MDLELAFCSQFLEVMIIPVLPPAFCVALGKVFTCFVPQFLSL